MARRPRTDRHRRPATSWFDAAMLSVGLATVATGVAFIGSGFDLTLTMAAGIWGIAALVFLVVSSIVVAAVRQGERQEEREQGVRQKTAAGPSDASLTAFAGTNPVQLAAIARRCRHRAKATGVLLFIASPFAALALGALAAQSEGYFDQADAGWTWIARASLVVGVLIGVSTLWFGIRASIGLLSTGVFAVIGTVRARIQMHPDGIGAMTEVDYDGFAIDVQQCHGLDRDGRLVASTKFTGTESFRGASRIVNSQPEGQAVALLCRGDRKVVHLFGTAAAGAD